MEMVKKKRATVVCFLGPVDKTNQPLLGAVACTPREPEHFLTTKMAGTKPAISGKITGGKGQIPP